MSMRTLMLLLALATTPDIARAEADTIYLDETVISGNQELPKVLYIVPWREQAGQAVAAVPPHVRLRNVMAPLSPGEFRRELAYRRLVRQMQEPEPLNQGEH